MMMRPYQGLTWIGSFNEGARGFISDNGTALAAVGSKVDRTSVNSYEADVTMFTYVASTYNRRKRFFIPASSGVYNGYNSVGIGVSGVGAVAATNNSFVHTFDAPVNKELDYILNLNFYYSWGRLT